MGVLRRHLPEGVLDDDRRIVAYTQFQKENALPTSGAEKVLIPLRCSVPAFVFHKGIIAAEIHGHRLATVRADRQKFRWYFHIFLPLDHFTDHGFVIESLLTARLTALKQAVVALRVEKMLFVKARLLEAVVDARRNDKIVLVPHQLEQNLVHAFRRVLIAVDEDIPAPIGPELFLRRVGIKSAAVQYAPFRKAIPHK